MDDTIAVQCLCFGLLILSAHLFGRLALKLKIGQMIGQLLGGIFVGPYFLEMTGLLDKLHINGYHDAFESFHYLIFAFLGVIAFALGEELHWDRLRKVGKKAAIISMIQGVLTWFLLTVFCRLAGFDWILALLIGSIGVATAPAITIILMNNLAIEGRFRNMIANILVLDDVLEVILFSIFVQIASKIYNGGVVKTSEVVVHLGKEFGLALLIGFGIFLFLKMAVRRAPRPEHTHSMDNTSETGLLSRLFSAHPTPSVEVLVLVMGSVAVGSGLALGIHIPFLITGIFAGILIANFHSHALFDSLKIDNVMPFLNLIFFAMIGANIRLDAFGGGNLWLILGYVATRSIGKLAGTYIGCKLTKQDPKVTGCLPFLMLPQAGVAAVEAVYVVKILGQQGQIVADVILPSLVIFEISGVFLSERALLKWRQWTLGEEELTVQAKSGKQLVGSTSEKLSELAQLVPKGLAGITVNSPTLTGAIARLAFELKKAECIVDSESVVELALIREKMASTAIGNGIVMPHSKTLGQMESVCAIGWLETPLEDVVGPDGLPIDTVVFMVSPIQKPESHLKALSTIARACNDADVRKKLKESMRDGTTELLFCRKNK